MLADRTIAWTVGKRLERSSAKGLTTRAGRKPTTGRSANRLTPVPG
jgi:hypothetical protein